MCGRYSIVINLEKLQQQFSAAIQLPAGHSSLPVNYNVAPTQSGLVLTDQQPDQLSLFRWGLVPFWAKDLKIGARMINARSEGIEDKPSFRKAIRQRRCLVIADSFYEWQRRGKEKQAFRILPSDGSLLVMAGIWERWNSPEQETIHSYSIITGAPNSEMQPIHDRMPMLLSSGEEQSAWLDAGLALPQVLNLLKTPADGLLRPYAVNSAVGNVRNNGPELHLPFKS